MKEKNRFSKPVAFNKNNPDDQRILKHVARRNFSGYVKKLILEDIRRREQEKAQNEAKNEVKMDIQKAVEEIKTKQEPEQKQISAAERLERLKQQAKQTSAPRIFINQQNN